MLIDLKPRSRQPAFGSVEVDWGHPLAFSLLACAVLHEGGGPGRNVVNGRRLDPAATAPTWRVVVNGLGLRFTDDTARYTDMTAPRAFSNTYSLFSIGTRDSTGVTRNILDHDDNIGSVRRFQLRFEAADVAQFIFFDTVPNAYTAGGATTVLLGPFSLGATLDSGKVGRVYLNGKDDGSVTGANTISSPPAAIRLGRFWGQALQPHNGNINLACAWDRTLTAAEMRWLHHEPYAFLRPRPAVRYWAKIAAAAPVITSRGHGALLSDQRNQVIQRV